MKKYVLGIDTSNYTTSAAITDRSGNIIFDERKLLKVKKGARGLRQQEALFQHVDNLPYIIDTVMNDSTRDHIAAVAVSSRPRSVEGSYMPCFKAGQTIGHAAASILGVPYMEFSHQEGHIAAVDPMVTDDFLCFHLSGGTGELLQVHNKGAGYETTIIGRTLDISPGQLIDRVGVAMGLDFPAGAEMDKMALAAREKPREKNSDSILGKVKIKDLDFNLSGIETKITRIIEEDSDSQLDKECIAADVFDLLADLLVRSSFKAQSQTGLNTIVFTGGVSKSKYLREFLRIKMNTGRINIYFGENSADNATGIAILGGRYIWE